MTDRGLLRTFQSDAMRVEVFADCEAMSRRAADAVLACLENKPDAVICAPSGSSPSGTYELLAQAAAARPQIFAAARIVKLDEYLGLPMEHPSTCEAYLRARLLAPCGIPGERYLAFDSEAPDPARECARVGRELSSWGGIDLLLLGLGLNGHLGLNEPADRLEPGPHVAELAEETRHHPMLQAHGATARQGLTLGIEDLLTARVGFLLVSGAHKRRILRAALTQPPSPRLPGSLLRRRAAFSCLCDLDAAGDLAGGRNLRAESRE
jgi:galactosamine-6-phosphate isomerase